MHVLEDRQARHQPRRQRRTPGIVRIDRSELLLEEPPVDRSRELHHSMTEVDNLVEPRPEEIALPRLPTFLRPHEKPPSPPSAQPGNHGRDAGSICKKTRPQQPQPGKYDYFRQLETDSQSVAWEFFTDD